MEASTTKTMIAEGNGYGADYGIYCMSLAHQIAELRREVGESECGVKESIHNQSLSMGKDFCDVNKNISDNAHRNVIEILTNRAAIKDAQCMLDKSILENRFFLAEKIDRETDFLKLQLGNFERSVDEKFCTVRAEAKDNTQKILDRLSSDKLDEKNNIIDELRHERRHLLHQSQLNLFSQDISSIKSMINSIDQDNKVTNKSIIFGNGANTTTTKNNNA